MQLIRTLVCIMAIFTCLRGDLCAKPPNLLLIVVDDQSPFDLQLYDAKSELQTPNIDRIAKRGMVLDAAYHMGANVGAVCTPSRHMIMSGRTVWHLPTAPRAAELSPKGLEDQTLGAVFRKAGYATMRTCKVGNSYEAANKQFEVRKDATKRGNTHETGSGWHGDQVVDYLDGRIQTQDQRPFFIHFGFSHPHDTRDGTDELLAKYGATNHTDIFSQPAIQAKQPKLPVNYLPKHPFNNTDAGVRDEVAVSGVWRNRDQATIRNEIGRQFACVEFIDQQVGRVLDKLQAMGELDNTFVIYTSDHGIAIGRHGLMGKQNLYEHTWRVPMIVSGPGIQPGTRALGNVYLLDLLATCCDLTGVAAPTTNEGLSFKSVLQGKQSTIRETLYGVYCGGAKPGMRCVKQGEWKLIRYESTDGKTKETQLFNLKDNPFELLAEHTNQDLVTVLGNNPTEVQRNLAADPKYADQLARMQGLLLAEMRRLDDPFRFSDQPDDGLPAVPGKAKAKKP